MSNAWRVYTTFVPADTAQNSEQYKVTCKSLSTAIACMIHDVPRERGTIREMLKGIQFDISGKPDVRVVTRVSGDKRLVVEIFR